MKKKAKPMSPHLGLKCVETGRITVSRAEPVEMPKKAKQKSDCCEIGECIEAKISWPVEMPEKDWPIRKGRRVWFVPNDGPFQPGIISGRVKHYAPSGCDSLPSQYVITFDITLPADSPVSRDHTAYARDVQPYTKYGKVQLLQQLGKSYLEAAERSRQRTDHLRNMSNELYAEASKLMGVRPCRKAKRSPKPSKSG